MRGVRGGQLGGGCCWVDGGGFDFGVCLLGFNLGGISMIINLVCNQSPVSSIVSIETVPVFCFLAAFNQDLWLLVTSPSFSHGEVPSVRHQI